jgi:hypothetical protein
MLSYEFKASAMYDEREINGCKGYKRAQREVIINTSYI